MKERPILFSGPMVKAILEGRKTQTRRLIKLPEAIVRLGGDLERAFPDKAFGVTPCLQVPCADGSVQRLRNPWGFPETSRLWVKEAWNERYRRDPETREKVLAGYNYRADAEATPIGPAVLVHTAPGFDRSKLKTMADLQVWENPRFMPRRASRITLEIANVRVEPLQAISEADAKAEGVTCLPTHNNDVYGETYHEAFVRSWNTINGKDSWMSDPWVWVVEFKKL